MNFLSRMVVNYRKDAPQRSAVSEMVVRKNTAGAEV